MYNQFTTATLQHASPLRSNAGFRSSGNYIANRKRRARHVPYGVSGLGLGTYMCAPEDGADCIDDLNTGDASTTVYDWEELLGVMPVIAPTGGGGAVATATAAPIPASGTATAAAACNPNVLYPTGSPCGIAANVRELQQIVTNMSVTRQPASSGGVVARTSTSTAPGASRTLQQTGADAATWVSANSTMVAAVGLGIFTLILATSGGSGNGRRR